MRIRATAVMGTEMIRLSLLLSVWAFSLGCLPTGGSDADGSDAGAEDAGAQNAEAEDAGAVDGGAQEVGELHPYCREPRGLYLNESGLFTEVAEYREEEGFPFTKVTVRRRFDGNAGIDTVDYSLERMSVETDDVDVCIVELASLTYEWVQGNSDDYAIAIDDESTYVLHMFYASEDDLYWLVTFEIRATESGAVTYGPIDMR